MDRAVRVAVIVACIAVTLAAIVITTVVVTRSFQSQSPKESAKTENTTPADSKEATSGHSKVEEACEEAQLKLLKGEVTDPVERGSLATAANRYCK